ncbi:MAG TPA: Clp protease N-terminal domain-containing protein [Capsulimonadaceae bacterium]|jgi:ATP-dependent Clp protease ATP-binding subunit ClpC
MWQRFTERARKVIFYAQEEAQRLGENYVSTEHMLLGLVRENDSVAAKLLDEMGVSLGRIRSEIERIVTRGDGRLGQDMLLTPRAKRVIDLAYDEARQLDNEYIGTEHLLLGLVREGEGLAGRVLNKLKVSLERTRLAVVAHQSGKSETDTGALHGTLLPDALRAVSSATDRLLVLRNGNVTGDAIVYQLIGGSPNTAIDLLTSIGVQVEELANALATSLDALPAGDEEPEGISSTINRVLHRADAYAKAANSAVIDFNHVLVSAVGHDSPAFDAWLAAKGVTLGSILAALPIASRGELPEGRDEGAPARSSAKGKPLRHTEVAVGDGRLSVTVDTRLSQAAMNALARASQESQNSGGLIVNDIDILIGLLRTPDGQAGHLLSLFGVTVSRVRDAIAGMDPYAASVPAAEESIPVVVSSPPSNSAPLDPGFHVVPAKPLSPTAKRALVVAHAEAESEGDDVTSAHHLFLALLQQKSGFTGQMVNSLGLDADLVRDMLDTLRVTTPPPDYDEE